MKVKVFVAHSCSTLWDPMDCSLPGSSSVYGILQARILEWLAILFSRASSRPRDQTWVSCTADGFFINSLLSQAPGRPINRIQPLKIVVLWPPHAKSWLIGKDSDAGRNWAQEEKGTTEDEMAGWHHWLDGRESEWTLGVGEGQGGLACCNSWGCKESDTTERLIWSDLILYTYNI